MNNDHLRAYQHAGIEAVFDEWTRVQATILNQATGTGKTVELAEIVRRSQPKRTLVLSHRRELVRQSKDKIERFTGLNAQVEMAGERAALDLFEKCHAVASSVQSQTPGRRSNPSDFDILIVDEMHHWKKGNKSYCDVINHYKQNPNLKILGLTATLTPHSRAMFDTVAFTYPILTAIQDCYLVDIEQQMVTIDGLDFSHVRSVAGDLHGGDLAALMDDEKVCQGMIMGTLEVMFGVPQHSLLELPVDKWGEFLFMDGKPRKNLIFTVSVAQAKMMSDIFNRVKPGISAWVCGDVNKVSEKERHDIGKEFHHGDLLIVCNCGIFSEGYDNPKIQMVTMARPTESIVLFTQQIGRGTRILDGVIDGLNTVEERRAAIAASDKKKLTVLDFTGNCGKHKLLSTVDLMGDGYSDEVKERAKKKSEKSKVPQNMIALLMTADEELKAEKIAKDKKERERQEAARKARLVAKSTYTLSSESPFEKHGVKYQAANDWERRHISPLTEKQRAVLKNIGVSPDEISASCGRKLIGAHFNALNSQPCSDKQAWRLRQMGLDPATFSRKQASEKITEYFEKQKSDTA